MDNNENPQTLPDFDNQEEINRAIDYMNEEALKKIKRNHPNLPDFVQEMQRSRGAGLEFAIMSEQIFNQILHYMEYSWEKILNLSYGEKIKEVIKILEKHTEKDNWRDETINNLLKAKRLRNIYAHTPGDYQSGILRFDPAQNYYKKEDEEFRFKSLKELNNIFADLAEDVMNKRVMDIFKKLIPIREKEKMGNNHNYGQINGLTIMQSQDFLKELDQIEGVRCGIYLRESAIEFKSVFTPFVIDIAKGVVIGLITAVILKFFQKNKDKPRISIQIGTNNGNINIYNGDTKEQVDEKLSKIISK